MYAPQPQPKQIQALSQFTVTKVACGQNHTLALTQEGQAFSWGRTLLYASYHKLPVSHVQHAKSLLLSWPVTAENMYIRHI